MKSLKSRLEWQWHSDDGVSSRWVFPHIHSISFSCSFQHHIKCLPNSFCNSENVAETETHKGDREKNYASCLRNFAFYLRSFSSLHHSRRLTSRLTRSTFMSKSYWAPLRWCDNMNMNVGQKNSFISVPRTWTWAHRDEIVNWHIDSI